MLPLSFWTSGPLLKVSLYMLLANMRSSSILLLLGLLFSFFMLSDVSLLFPFLLLGEMVHDEVIVVYSPVLRYLF